MGSKVMTRRKAPRQSKLDEELDQALAQTFPASDPFSVGRPTATEPPARPVDRLPPILAGEEVAAAQRRG
jgi:hypothetical protein